MGAVHMPPPYPAGVLLAPLGAGRGCIVVIPFAATGFGRWGWRDHGWGRGRGCWFTSGQIEYIVIRPGEFNLIEIHPHRLFTARDYHAKNSLVVIDTVGGDPTRGSFPTVFPDNNQVTVGPFVGGR